jgi:hypothetical protein
MGNRIKWQQGDTTKAPLTNASVFSMIPPHATAFLAEFAEGTKRERKGKTLVQVVNRGGKKNG